MIHDPNPDLLFFLYRFPLRRYNSFSPILQFSLYFLPIENRKPSPKVVQLVAWCKAATSCETPLRCHGHSSIWKPSYAAKRHRVWRGFRGDGDGWGRGEVCSGRIRGRNQPYMVLLVTSAQCKFPRSKDIPKISIERFSEHLMELWPLLDQKMAGIASFTSSLDRNCIAVSKPSKRRYKVRWRPVGQRDPTTSLA